VPEFYTYAKRKSLARHPLFTVEVVMSRTQLAENILTES
jgi:hypothetical protein